jgi:hypothetical protein
MKESIINKKKPTLLFGLLFVGSVAVILGIFRAAKNIQRPPGDAYEEYEENIFVCDAQP